MRKHVRSGARAACFPASMPSARRSRVLRAARAPATSAGSPRRSSSGCWRLRMRRRPALPRDRSHVCSIILGQLGSVAFYLQAGDQLGIGAPAAAHRGQAGAACPVGGRKGAPLFGDLVARRILALDTAVDILLHAENSIGGSATAWREIELGYLVGDQHRSTDHNRGENRDHDAGPVLIPGTIMSSNAADPVWFPIGEAKGTVVLIRPDGPCLR